MNQEPITESEVPDGPSIPEDTSSSPAKPTDEERFQNLELAGFLQMEEKATERDKFLDHLQRKEAELINFRKRVQKERVELRRFGAQFLIQDLLPNLNAMELAIDAARLEGTETADILQGIEQLYQQFTKGLADHGVLEIDALGQPFDPTFHEVMLSEETTEFPHMNIIEVIQKGYRLHDRLLRPARVKVARRPAEEKSDATASEPSEQ